MAGSNPSALAVIHSFGIYEKGALITDAIAIKAVMEGGMKGFVVPTILPVVPKSPMTVD